MKCWIIKSGTSFFVSVQDSPAENQISYAVSATIRKDGRSLL